METKIDIAANLDAAILDAEYARLWGCDRESTEAEIRFLAGEVEKAGIVARPAQLAETFSLTPLELDLALLAAAPEVAPGIPRAAQVLEKMGSGQGRATVRMAASVLNSDWLALRQALGPAAQLRHWQLVSLTEPADPLPVRELVADSRIADFLLGGDLYSAELSRVARLRAAGAEHPNQVELRSPEAIAVRAIRNFFQVPTQGRRLFILLSGGTTVELEDLASKILGHVGMRMLVVEAAGITPRDRTLALRESLLAQTALLIHGIAGAGPEITDSIDWYRWLAVSAPVVFLTQAQGTTPMQRPPILQGHGWVDIGLPPLDAAQRTRLWSAQLRELRLPDGDGAQTLAAAAALTEREISETVVLSAGQARAEGRSITLDDLLNSCRARVPHKLRELSQRFRCRAAWSDLILPSDTRARLQELCQEARLQRNVLIDGGFGRTLTRGRAVTGLFWGPSGTGKTLAAEVIAHELHRELYRVDSARIVSKYIGETEKNLRQIFDEAERARCVLFFDEADALFGTRTEARDSHDRYANLEVSYLLQLIEESEHAVILLASNRRQSIDEAFVRRFRFMVEFTMPSAALRRDLWASSFPAEFPLDGSVRLDLLADRLQLNGASIRNIALSAAYLAAAENAAKARCITAANIAHAVRREFEKLSSPMPITLADLIGPQANGTRARAGAVS